jgi:ArsR family transcriptional regulator
MPASAAPTGRRNARLFHALADETRLRILDRLAVGEQCVCDLTGALGAAQSRLSFHLKTLKAAGLLTDRREGRWIYYTLNRAALQELRSIAAAIGVPRPGALQIVSRRCD